MKKTLVFFFLILSNFVSAHGSEGGYFGLVDIELYLVFILAIVAAFYAFKKNSYLGTTALSLGLIYLLKILIDVFRLFYVPENALLHITQIFGIIAFVSLILGVKELK